MRDPSHKLIGGVCSGLAKYLNMDVNLVRILTVLISLFTGIPIVLYIIALFVLPEERPEQQPPYVNGPQPNAYGTGFTAQGNTSGYHQPAYGQPTPPPADEVWGSAGAPWEQPQAAPASQASAPASPSTATGAVAQDQTWQQPAWHQPEAEPTRYDTAPVEPGAASNAEDTNTEDTDAVDTDAVDTAEGSTPTEDAAETFAGADTTVAASDTEEPKRDS